MKKTILLAAGTTLMFGCSTINTDIISRPDIVASKLTLSAEANEINVPAWVSIGSGVFQPDNEGSRYEGEWKDGKYNGQGTYTLIDGNRFEGEWKDGKPWNLTIADKNGNIIRKWDNGVEQKETP